MVPTASRPNYSFWLLLSIPLLLAGLGLALVARGAGPGWVQSLWHACQSGLQNLDQHLPTAWQVMILALGAVVLSRGGWSLARQVRRTRQMADLFSPWRERPPTGLKALLATHGLRAEDLVYLDLAGPRAFCLGFWRPRIWLTKGLVKLLTGEELAAVVAHETYHLRQRDPLRLVISRALQAAFFFLPLLNDLAQAAELQQEVAADQFAVAHLGDDLPLLCALQKLLGGETQGAAPSGAAVTPFNVTEARLRRLIYPSRPTPLNWRRSLLRWTLNVGVVVVLAGIGLFSTQPVVEHGELGACTIGKVSSLEQTQLSWPGFHP
ncbi:MAG: M56 family metallopeptidase [Anaerolineae bacterium]